MQGIQLAKKLKPDAITLDVTMPNMDGWSVLSQLKSDHEVADIPVVMVSMLDERNRGFALGADEYLLKPIDRNQLMNVLQRYQTPANESDVIMIVEDNSILRHLVSHQLTSHGWKITEARNGQDALDKIQASLPGLIILDLMMPELDGFEFVYLLSQHPRWSQIPVLVITAKELSKEDKAKLQGRVENILQKGRYEQSDLLNEVHKLLALALERQTAIITVDSSSIEDIQKPTALETV